MKDNQIKDCCGNCLHYKPDLYGDFGFCEVYRFDVKPSDICFAHDRLSDQEPAGTESS